MSENLLSPLVDTMLESSKLILKCIKKALGLNTLDFKQFFIETNLCNHSKQCQIKKK